MSPLQKLTMVIVLMCVQASAHADCVVLLHGLARTSKAMDKLASELAELDYKIANVDYPSREKPIEELSPLVVLEGIRQCQTPETEKIHFVTHSMGGILIRYYLESNEIDNLGHVVMIAPPNQGSEVVDMLSGVPGYALVNGPAGQQLGTDPNSIPSNMGPVDYSVGVIAGNKTFNPLLSQFLPNPDDGKVSVERTKVEGMADFVVVNVSHPFIMEDDAVIGYTLNFLKSGSFGASSP
jgi:triacylglycerol lipase